jgi:hypothetical protein
MDDQNTINLTVQCETGYEFDLPWSKDDTIGNLIDVCLLYTGQENKRRKEFRIFQRGKSFKSTAK